MLSQNDPVISSSRIPNSSLRPDQALKLPSLDDLSIAIVHSYSMFVESRIKALASSVEVSRIDSVGYGKRNYNLYRIESFVESDPKKIPVLISAGVHGDEPAGIFTILQFFETLPKHLKDRFEFTAYPCVNPSGFEANTLESMRGENLNRLWKAVQAPQEIESIKADLTKLNRTFRFMLDMHEAPPYYIGETFSQSDNPTGSWLYETQRDISKLMGRQMVDSMPADIPVCDWPLIYNDRNEKGLVYFLPETTTNAVYAQSTTFDSWVFERFSHHCFVSETPTGLPYELRIKAHTHYLEKALEIVSNA